jgi:superfamily II DNA helicase RecQ
MKEGEMQYKILSIPSTGDVDMEEALNRFLRGRRVVSVKKELVVQEGSSDWCFCIEYIDSPASTSSTSSQKRPKVDYKAILSEEEFALFAKLRDVRKELAAKEAVPVYAVCTNQQLAEMAKGRVSRLADLKKIEGFGEAKAEKYGQALLGALDVSGEEQNETSGAAD